MKGQTFAAFPSQVSQVGRFIRSVVEARCWSAQCSALPWVRLLVNIQSNISLRLQTDNIQCNIHLQTDNIHLKIDNIHMQKDNIHVKTDNIHVKTDNIQFNIHLQTGNFHLKTDSIHLQTANIHL